LEDIIMTLAPRLTATITFITVALLSAYIFGAPLPVHAQHHGGHVMVAPADLKWTPVPSLPAGAEIAVIEGPLSSEGPITARIKFPANYRLPAHTHPVIEHVTVLSGTFHMGTGDKLDTTKTKALTPGAFAIMQPGTRHFAWTAEETIVQIHSVGPWGINYVNPADDPRKK
jgi:quercetin dioxygenase-like cupin family protein